MYLYGLIFLLSIFVLISGLILIFDIDIFKEKQKLNLIFLLADDHRHDILGFAGNSIIKTPNLDLFAENSSYFKNAFVTSSVCWSSRASILTGQYPAMHLYVNGSIEFPKSKLKKTFPVILKSNGWKTGYFGKWGLGKDFPVEEFDDFIGYTNESPFFEKGIHVTKRLGDLGSSFIEKNKDTPFALFIAFKSPHAEYFPKKNNWKFSPDPAFIKLYEEVFFEKHPSDNKNSFNALPLIVRQSVGAQISYKNYYGAEFQETIKSIYALVSGIDSAVGRILESITEHGLEEDTIVIFTSDNGYLLGEKMLGGKHIMYEPSIRVPLIIHVPRTKAQSIKEMALNIDLAPTALDLLGIDPPAFMQGKSLKPLILNKPVSWRKDWLYQYSTPMNINGFNIPLSEGVRSDTWKYIYYPQTKEEELFNLEKDPNETSNLAQLLPDKTEFYKARLTNLKRECSFKK